jgi:quinol monooxygenase YgiN
MSEPIVFISHSTVKEGRLEDLKDFLRAGATVLQAEKPGTVAFLAYIDDEGSELSIVHVFPDADAMDLHLQGVDERAGAADEFIQTQGYEIYGIPSETVLATMRRYASSEGVPLTVRPDKAGGYLRPLAG